MARTEAERFTESTKNERGVAQALSTLTWDEMRKLARFMCNQDMDETVLSKFLIDWCSGKGRPSDNPMTKGEKSLALSLEALTFPEMMSFSDGVVKIFSEHGVGEPSSPEGLLAVGDYFIEWSNRCMS